MDSFDALCHSFSTVATGGFSTRTASVGAFDSPLIEFIIVVFMLLGSINFTLHYRLWVERRPKRFISDFELRALLFVVVSASLVIAAILALKSGYAPAMAFRKALFQVTAITTTTGFTTDNFARWLPLPQLILLALMFMGGCTGSTSGGLKTARIVLLCKVVIREFERMVERRGVFAVRVGNWVIPETAVRSLLNLVYLSFLVNFLGCMLLAASGVDVFTSIAAVAATMFNIGPGLGNVGPLEGYGGVPAFAKWVLSFCMLAGRLGVLRGARHFYPGLLAKVVSTIRRSPVYTVKLIFERPVSTMRLVPWRYLPPAGRASAPSTVWCLEIPIPFPHAATGKTTQS